jgi:Sulfatase-modifying factor enzyme 1/TIR domain
VWEDGALSDPGPSDPDVFLSYAREDEAQARELATALEREGFAVFWNREVPPGQTWHSCIGAALAGAKCVVVAWSSDSFTSQWVIEEASEGKDRNALVPVLFETVQPPFGFRTIQAASLIDWRPGRPSPAFEGLLGAVRRIVGEQPGSGTEPAIPDQAEWEYAARAGSTTAYWWGDEVGRGNANCDGCGSQWDGKQAAPVGSFAANPFGLYDTAGNVWEWVQDCYHGNYGAPKDEFARKDGSDCGRVLRGGSWSCAPRAVRSSIRFWSGPGVRLYGYGFRVARTAD